MSDTPLRLLPETRESGGILPWVIAAMVYLTALAVAGGFGLRNAAAGWTSDLAQTITVQIAAPEAEARSRQTQVALDSLKSTPGILSARALTPVELSALLEPWLGAGNVSSDLPVPQLIDVKLDDTKTLDIASLEQGLRAVAPDASVDTHQQWLGQLSSFTRSIEWTANLVILLVTFATIAIVAFGTRSGMANHQSTISVLHMMGAEDTLIAGEFQRRFLIHGLQGGVVGVLLGVITIAIIGMLAKRAGDGLIGAIGLPWTTWAVLATLPILAGVITMYTARVTVHRALQEIL
jgi:cell division transport system permease protein